MTAKYWLIKTETTDYSWKQMQNDRLTLWSGIKNPQAIGYMQQMSVGDSCLFYETDLKKQTRLIMGIVRVHEHEIPQSLDFPSQPRSICPRIYMSWHDDLLHPLSLRDIKAAAQSPSSPLQHCRFLIQARLSVSPLSSTEWNEILRLAREYTPL